MAESDDGAHAAVLFDTPIGVCALAWTDRGIVRFRLPESTPDEATMRARFARARLREAEPTDLARTVIEAVRRHLTGRFDDFRWIPLDHTGIPEFHRAVYRVTRSIDPGHTLGYGQVAARAGRPHGAQAVGQAMGRNPIPLIVPCHRVLAADHALHGFSAPGGLETKQRLLEIEQTPGFGEPTLF
ncbi:methylated-DNA--[protein]-cysteine S-methyltransferase [Nocardia aurantia]|uniref:methylated-DNA--[protein]-cysteine S-methyltransferase n=1 Tax=Nocardia aurantia TaxID=2585199 RepID=A0A7K0DZC5_9NOCA|nr:methylated-DNA--[protein]-cysteine S-methyltransferase [Nocardia aurantia]MQY31031.1 Methylated-DNA--protein-cysteine methyltransferase [Nocardia aurantia]